LWTLEQHQNGQDLIKVFKMSHCKSCLS